MKGSRRLFLGIQWDARSWDDAPLWCDLLFQKLEAIPLHWSFPALPQDGRHKKRTGFLRLFMERIDSRGDVVAPMGFVGACNPLLTREELEKEISWAFQNPWGTGICDALDVKPTTFMPRLPDSHRPFALDIYRAHGLRRIGFESAARFGLTDRGGIEFFPYCRLELGNTADPALDPRRLQRLIEGRESRFIVLDLSGIASMAPLRSAVEEIIRILRGCAGEISTIEKEASGTVASGALRGARRPGPSLDWASFPAPVARAKLAATASLTLKKSKRKEDFQKILSTLAPGPPPEQARRGSPADSGGEKTLIAHMNGEITLKGRDFDVKLVGGRFCGIVRGKEILLARKPATSLIRIDGKTMVFASRSSVSFERESGTGLREELALEGRGGGSLAIEYYFRDESPELCIAVDIRYPAMRDSSTIEEYRPFAFTLLEVPRRRGGAIDAVAPDGSSVAYPLAHLDECAPIPGTMHRIGLPGGRALTLRCLEAGSRGGGLPYFRIARSWSGKAILEANPFGSYSPTSASWLSGARKTHLLMIGFEEQPREKTAPEAPRAAKRTTPARPRKSARPRKR